MTSLDKLKVLKARLEALEAKWKADTNGLPFPTSLGLARKAVELADGQAEALALAVRQSELIHLPEAEWRARRAAAVDGSQCPCDHWLAFECEMCRGACSCHWRQNV